MIKKVIIQAQVDQLISDVIDNSIDVDYLKGVIVLNQIDIESQKEQLDELNLKVTDLRTPGIGSIVAWIPGLINLKYSFD